MTTDFTKLSKVFAALASEPRLQLVGAVSSHEHSSLCVSDLAGLTEMPRLRASHHLDILRRAGILHAIPEGRRLVQAISPDALCAIEDWLYPLTREDV